MVPGRGLSRGARLGPYEVVDQLGRGGMARVYLARSADGTEVALKVLEPEYAGGARAARFAREVGTAARLSHAGCARLVDHGSTATGVLYLVIERLLGITLRDLLNTGRTIPIAEVVRIGHQLCEALAHAHEQGVHHRDIKPENVMYRGPGETGGIVLIDFGLSRLRDDAPLTAVGTCLGSPSYVAPERLLERPADGRADLYAVGVLLYELLAGHPPFVGKQPVEIARLHIASVPRPIGELRSDTPAPLAAIIHRALEKDPEQRFTSAATMAIALEGVPLGEDADSSRKTDEWQGVFSGSGTIP